MSSKEGKEENLNWYRKGKLETKDFIKNRLSLNAEDQDAKTSINGNVKKENSEKKDTANT